MDYTWTPEYWGQKDVNYRVAGRAFVGKGHSKHWWHVSLHSPELGRWVRQDGVHPTAEEARQWAELLLDDLAVR